MSTVPPTRPTEDLERLQAVLRLQREHYMPLKVIRELADAGKAVRDLFDRAEFPESTAEAIRSALTDRLMRAWDGTAEGALALETILDGAARLRQARPRRR